MFQSSEAFHLASALITACLGLQKCIAIEFPIWTRTNLTKKKSVICCILCVIVSISVSAPQFFTINFMKNINGSEFLPLFLFGQPNTYFKYESACYRNVSTQPWSRYSITFYNLLFAVILDVCCTLMLFCTIYMVFKLLRNKFSGRQTDVHQHQKRSAAMTVTVLVTFLLSELPRMIILGYIFKSYLSKLMNGKFESKLDSAVTNRRYALAMVFKNEIPEIRFETALLIVEGMKLFTLLGCISNFVIYLTMSSKLRQVFISFFKKIVRNT